MGFRLRVKQQKRGWKNMNLRALTHLLISQMQVMLHRKWTEMMAPSNPPKKKGVPSAESSRSVRGVGKGVSGKPYPRLCNARRPRLEPGTFQSQAVRLYRLHQARPSNPTMTKSVCCRLPSSSFDVCAWKLSIQKIMAHMCL